LSAAAEPRPVAGSAPAAVREASKGPGPGPVEAHSVPAGAPAEGGPAAPLTKAPAPPEAGTAPAPRAPPAATREPSAIPGPPPRPDSGGPASSLISDARFTTAVRQIDAGDPSGAARQFESWIPAENPGRYTLQIMIACEQDTVKGARSRSGADAALFIL